MNADGQATMADGKLFGPAYLHLKETKGLPAENLEEMRPEERRSVAGGTHVA